MSETLKKITIALTLGLLTVSAFFIRLDNVVNTKAHSIDEVVYVRMALQVKEKITDYNTIPYGRELASGGRKLPEYFMKPLYKHPPLFTYLLALTFKLFGASLHSVAYIPLIFSVLCIPLVYWLGTIVFDRRSAMLAACFLAFDPLSVMSSQKTWMESTLAFWTFLSIIFFIVAIKNKRDVYFLWGGMAAGLATLTKYTGVISIATLLVYALVYQRQYFKNKYFIGALLMPFLFLAPWLMWNFKVYGLDYLSMQLQLHSDAAHTPVFMMKVMVSVLLGFVLYRLFPKIKDDMTQSPWYQKNSRLWQQRGVQFLGLAFLIIFSQDIMKSLDIMHLPKTSWRGMDFYNSPPTFYIYRLMEFSLIYLFSYMSYFGLTTKQGEAERVLRLAPIVILIAYIIWGSFQSRYIIAALPFLILLGCAYLTAIYDRLEKNDNFLARLAGKAVVLGAILLCAVKINYINQSISYLNNYCYF